GLIVCVAAAISFLRTARRPDYRENVSRAMQPVAALLPHTKGERRLWAAISVTAGICEEILFRGFLIFYLSQVLPSLPLIAVVVISSVIFGFGHAYQGLKGIIGTGILGLGLAVLYVATGSLLLSMVIHALVDVRVLLVWRPESLQIEAPTEEAV
ncbi:MAG: CPBP family intramembrane glutamic endopeptidase, partial [Candidatus Aquicultor sp.]